MAHQYMQSVMTGPQHFAQAPQVGIERSSFNRSHGFKTTFNSGDLVPIFVDEVLPGDTFNLKCNTFARLATQIVPFMDNLFADTFFFFVPNRLIWNNWEKFNGAQDNPGDSTSYVVPSLPLTNFSVGTLQDFMGLPTDIATATVPATVNTLHFRAYNLIWNTWFRDENLQNSVTVVKDDGGTDAWTNYTVLKRGKRHDYFTSCLPWPQKGAAVTLPLGSTAPILRTPNAVAWTGKYGGTNTDTTTGAITFSGNVVVSPGSGAGGVSFDPNGGLYADLSSATSATINAIRQAFQTQKFLERDARGGTRYTEILKSHFGVTSPDARLQRPELLGQSSTRININPVVQTAPTTAGVSPQGNLASYGTFSHSGSRNGFVHSFVEHGVLIGLISVRADLNYQQGLPKMWSRQTRYDFYWPSFAHLGEQSVLNKEIYLQNTAVDNQVFGYQERYAEYRYKQSVITGQFRSTYAQTLDIWHLAQKFTSLPTLGNTFIQENPPIARVIAVPSQPQFLLDCYFEMNTARPMPVFSVPGYIDRF